MASIYKRDKSPFWWLKWHNPATGKIERISTECRVGNGKDYARVIQLRNEHSLKESRSAGLVSRRHPFHEWVTEFLTNTHSNSPKTLQRYLGIWKLMASYLATRNIISPQQVKRDVCLAYVPWRIKVPHLTSGKKPVSINTVIVELKLLGKVMQEAVRRDYIQFNVCTRLGLRKDPPRIKEEISDEHAAIIHQEIQRRLRQAETEQEIRNARFLATSFEIARLQGIRLSETFFPLDMVNPKTLKLTVRGKGNKLEEVNLNPALVPLLKKLKAEGRTTTYDKPRMPSLVWFKLFDRLRSLHEGFKNISYHSTRVTMISRMERAGAPEEVVMKTVLHSSTTVHRGYRRVHAKELEPYWPSVGNASSDTNPRNENPDEPPPNPK